MQMSSSQLTTVTLMRGRFYANELAARKKGCMGGRRFFYPFYVMDAADYCYYDLFRHNEPYIPIEEHNNNTSKFNRER